MQDLPTGTVTFRFTDVEGSTQLLEELGRRSAGFSSATSSALHKGRETRLSSIS